MFSTDKNETDSKEESKATEEKKSDPNPITKYNFSRYHIKTQKKEDEKKDKKKDSNEQSTSSSDDEGAAESLSKADIDKIKKLIAE